MTQHTTNAPIHKFRKLEDLNLIDNFLFQQMLLQEEGEEFARILLSTFLEKPIKKVKIIPQKPIPGIDTNHHGIQLDAYIEDLSDTDNSESEKIPDIYDIEPNRRYEKRRFRNERDITTVSSTLSF